MTVGLIIGLICAGIAIGMVITLSLFLVVLRSYNRKMIHIQTKTEEKLAELLLEETNPCVRCVHCYECNDPETYVEGAPLPPKEKCIKGIIEYTCREAGRKKT